MRRQFVILFVVFQFFKVGLTLPGEYKGPLHRSDLFLDRGFFVGTPDIGDVLEEVYDKTLYGNEGAYARAAQQARVAIDEHGDSKGTAEKREMTQEQEEEDTSDNWPGRQGMFPMTNAGADVVSVYANNLMMYLQTVENIMKSNASDLTNLRMSCNETCSVFDPRELTSRYGCLFHCSTQGQERLQEISVTLSQGLRTICHVTNTLFLRFDEFKIRELELFQQIMTRAKSLIRAPISMNVPLRSALVRLTKELKSTFSPFKKLNSVFNDILKVTNGPLQLTGKVLVGAHPGCSTVDIGKAAWKMLDVVSKDSSLIDYIVFQGYALFTAITKYLDEFPTKKAFAAINQGLDMMVGTSCGLYVYGSFGNKLNCDQFGGHPVLDMPVPDYLWSDDNQADCEKMRESMLLNGGNGGGQTSPNQPNTDKKQKRRRRSLMVGMKKEAY